MNHFTSLRSALLLEGSQSPSPGGTTRQRSTPEAEGQPGSDARNLVTAGLPSGLLGTSAPQPGSPGGFAGGPGQASGTQQLGPVTDQAAGPQPGRLTAVGEAAAASTSNLHAPTRSAAEGPAGGAAQPAADPSAEREERSAAGEGQHASEAPVGPMSQAQAQAAPQQAEQTAGPHVTDTGTGHEEQEQAHDAPSSAPPATLLQELRGRGAAPQDHAVAAATASASAPSPTGAAEATALPREPAPVDFEMWQAQHQQPMALVPQGSLGHGQVWGLQPDPVSEVGRNPEAMDLDQGGGGSTPGSGAGSLVPPPAPPPGSIAPQSTTPLGGPFCAPAAAACELFPVPAASSIPECTCTWWFSPISYAFSSQGLCSSMWGASQCRHLLHVGSSIVHAGPCACSMLRPGCVC